MFKKYFRIIIKKTEKYNKKAQNPFINPNNTTNPFREIKEQTCIWVDKTK